MIFLTSVTYGQINISSWRAFEENPELIKTQASIYETFINDTYPDSIPQNLRSEYKAYLRYMYFWQRRLGEDAQGELSYKPYYQAAIDNKQNPICLSDPLADWGLIEPGYEISQNQGLISEVLYDPLNPDEPLVSSNHGGLWKFNSSLEYWYNVTDSDNLRVPGISATEIVRNPFDHNKLYASTGSGIHKVDYGMGIIESDDNGASWSIMPGFPHADAPRVVKIVIDPNDNNSSDGINMYAIGEEKVYYTINSGLTWDTLAEQPLINNHTELYDLEVGSQGGLLLSTIGKYGYTAQCFKYKNSVWTEILSNDTTINPQRTKFTKPFNGLVFALSDINLSTGSVRRLYKSTDNGNTWQVSYNNIFGADPKCEIEYSPQTNFLYIGRVSLWVLNHTTNQLISVNHITYGYHADVRDIQIISNAGNYETILFANDGGITEFEIDTTDMTNFSITNYSGHFLTVNNLIGIGVGNGSTEFALAGGVHGNSLKVFNEVAFPGDGGDGSDCMVNPEDENIYYSSCSAVLKSSKSGSFYIDNDQWFIGMRYEMDPNNYDIIYFGQKDTIGIYNENTQQVVVKPTPRNASGQLFWVGAIEKSKNGILYISDFCAKGSNMPFRMAKSTNEGDTWTDMSANAVYDANGSPDGTLGAKVSWKTINSIESNPDNPNELWLCVGGVFENNKYRVLHSTNGGDTWYDYSSGLTDFPANYVYYHYPTEMLFVATDVGVFYRDPSDSNMTDWECFSNNMPVGIVTDLDASTCNNMLYASLDGRGIYRTPIPFPIINGANTITYENSYVVSGDEVWNTTRYFDGDIMLPPNTSLRINDKVLFTENGSITVMPNAELYVNGVLDIAEQCSHTFWKGIQVRGNANSPQIPQYQGAVRTLSNAEIRNAKIAIAAYGIDNNDNMITNSQGGIIVVDQATFVNNKIGIDIRDYNYTNTNTAYKPVVINSSFYTNGIYYVDPMETPIGVRVLHNNNVSISSCQFIGDDFLTYLPNTGLLPIGVKAWDSPTKITNCEFTDIGYGVYAIDYYASSHLVDIDQNIFYNCINSIYLNGLSNPRITRNTIRDVFHENIVKQYLVYINECSNFIVEENELTLWATEDHWSNPNFGIIVNNCGATNNTIYKNDFMGGYCGVLAQNQNRDANGQNGLTIKCNTFEQTVRNNIMVSARGISTQNGIAAAQGSMGSNASDPAGNLFSQVFINPNNGMTTTDGHFWNISSLTATVTYYHHNISNSLLLKPGYNNQNNLINGVLRQVNDVEWSDNSCPSHFPSGGGGNPQGRMASAGDDIDNTQNSLDALTDGGDTQALNTEVATANNNEGYALRNELLSSSPYISDTVLQNASNKEEVLSNPLIRDVLVANPQAAKNQAVLNAIDNRSNIMPDYMKQQILNGQTIAGQKEQLQAGLQHSKTEYNNAINYVIAQYYKDTTICSIDSIIPLLASAKTLESQYQLAGIYLQQANATAMNNVLSNIPSNYNLDSYSQIELQDLTAYYGLLQNAKAQNRNIYELTDTEKASLWSWRNDSVNIASTYARNLLIYLGELEYKAPIILPDMNKSALITEPYVVDIPKEEYGVINIYPNPAKDYIIFEYDIKVEFKIAQIIITESSTGKNMKTVFVDYKKDSKTIDVNQLQSGAYIISIKIDGTIFSSTKFNIAR